MCRMLIMNLYEFLVCKEPKTSFNTECFKICGSSRRRQFVATLIAVLIFLDYGIIKGWPSPSLKFLRNKHSPLGTIPITEEQESWLGSLPFLGALVSTPIYSFINQNLGRKTAGYATALPVIVGFLFIIFGKNISFYLIGRFIMGFTLSGANIFMPLYVGEISEDKLRGFFGNIRGVVGCFGFLIIFSAGPNISIQNTAILAISISIAFLITFFWLPESPMFLLGKAKSEAAMESYVWLRGNDNDLAKQEMSKLSTVTRSDSIDNLSLWKLLSIRGTRKALLITVVMTFVQEFSGFDIVISYGANLFDTAGSIVEVDNCATIISVVTILGSLFSSLVSDVAGRRPILIWTQVIQGIALGCVGLYFYLKIHGADVSTAALVPLICTSIYIFCTVVGQMNMLYLLMAEIFRPEARGLSSMVCSFTNWTLAFVSTKIFQILVDVIEFHGVFWLFSCVSFFGAAFIFFLLPETKHRHLETIVRELDGNEMVVVNS